MNAVVGTAPITASTYLARRMTGFRNLTGIQVCRTDRIAGVVVRQAPTLQRIYRMAKKHPGFQGAQQSIEKKEGVSKKAAGAILAEATRKASPAAKKANPNLKKVK